MTPVTPQWQGWINDQALTRSLPANPEKIQVTGVLPQTLFMGQTQQPPASQINQGLNIAPTEKSDSRVPTSSGGPSSNHSTPSKGASTSNTTQEVIRVLEQAHLNQDTIEWLDGEGLGSPEHLTHPGIYQGTV